MWVGSTAAAAAAACLPNIIMDRLLPGASNDLSLVHIPHEAREQAVTLSTEPCSPKPLALHSKEI